MRVWEISGVDVPVGIGVSVGIRVAAAVWVTVIDFVFTLSGCARVFVGIDVAPSVGISDNLVGSEVGTFGELQPKVPAKRNTTNKYENFIE